MAKSKGRTQRPARTSRSTAQPSTSVENDATLGTDAEAVDSETSTADVDESTTADVEETTTETSSADEAAGASAVDAEDAVDESATEATGTKKDAAAESSTADESATEAKETTGKATAKKTTDSKKTVDAKRDAKKATATKRTSRSGNPAKRSQGRKTASYTSQTGQQTIKPNPSWFLPVLIGLLLIGLIWLVAFYITQGAFPVEAWGNWNILIGFTFFVAGLIMSTRWR
ncbi:uncharacterized protein UPF0233 [Brevibacterium sanguinis]|uniref:Cell division protein CrgA n=2 Tax=Brevibacterium TaxID=1696 RepID=A0A366INR3_9MICO|nr:MULTISPECIES: cell division protein CrgA [Brevibacterium]RBP67290.1 uncharacterized protein UPF0233 [Brevibacterium sanguinis]RBP73815.1 uncharacterized protein UPF0233 [Brevibacterium celere]